MAEMAHMATTAVNLYRDKWIAEELHLSRINQDTSRISAPMVELECLEDVYINIIIIAGFDVDFQIDMLPQ